MAKQIIIILSYNMQYQKCQKQYPREKMSDPSAGSKTYWSSLILHWEKSASYSTATDQ